MTIRHVACLVGMTFLLISIPAGASCTGSGTNWTCGVGTTSSQVNSVIGSAADGATVTFDNGAYSWSSTITFSLSRGITLTCASVGGCTVTTSGTTFGFGSGSSTKLYRISGFVFKSTTSSVVWTCPGGGCIGTITQFRIDHNTFNATFSGSTPVLVMIGENTAKQYVYGVMDHNTVTCTESCYFLHWLNGTDNNPPPPPMGTVNNMFVEDNTVTINSLTDLGTGCMDSWGQSAIVWRHNTSMNCRVISHGVTHSGGPSNIEIYDNTIQETDSNGSGCYRCIHHQGSNTMLAFDNAFTTTGSKDGDPAAFLHYCSLPGCIDNGLQQCDGTQSRDGNRSPTSTYRGYPCWRQPGRDVTGKYSPSYFWNNKWSDTGARIDMSYDDPGGSPDYSSQHIQMDREYFDAVSINPQSSPTSPFNGTTGMGFGTLANRPTTCTTSSETAFGNGAAGVGYFATDDGAQGTLYTCSATNTWTAYYQPYTYPHPLTGNGQQGQQPQPPTDLQADIQ